MDTTILCCSLSGTPECGVAQGQLVVGVLEHQSRCSREMQRSKTHCWKHSLSVSRCDRKLCMDSCHGSRNVTRNWCGQIATQVHSLSVVVSFRRPECLVSCHGGVGV